MKTLKYFAQQSTVMEKPLKYTMRNINPIRLRDTKEIEYILDAIRKCERARNNSECVLTEEYHYLGGHRYQVRTLKEVQEKLDSGVHGPQILKFYRKAHFQQKQKETISKPHPSKFF